MALSFTEQWERYKKQKLERKQKEYDRIMKKLQKQPLTLEYVSKCLKYLIEENADLKEQIVGWERKYYEESKKTIDI